MGKINSIKFNFVMNSILTVSAMIFPVITYPYVSRILQPQGIGTVSFANSVVTYFSMFAQLGIPTYGIRACAKVRDDKSTLSRLVQEIFLINIITCVIVYIAFACSLIIVPAFRQEKTLYIVMGSLILFNTIGVEWLYKSLEQYSYITIRSLIFKFIAMLAMFILIQKKEDYVLYGGITIFAAVGSNIMNFINLRKFIYFRPIGHYHLKQHLRPIAIFFFMSIATTIYTNMDNVMLGFICGTTENGYYDAAVKIKNVLVGVVASLGTVLMPRVSYYIEVGEEKEFYRITKKSLKFIYLLAIALCLYFILFAAPSIYLISGDLFAPSILPMRLIMPTLVFIGLTNIIGLQMLVPMGREKQVLYSEIAGAIINLIINSILIPKMGAAGAAIGTVSAEITVFIYQIIVLKKVVVPILCKLPYKKSLLALVNGTVISVWILLLNLGSLITLVVSSIMFFGVYVLTLLLMKEELTWEILGQVIKLLRNAKDKLL